MTTIFSQFDSTRQAFINPGDVLDIQSGFPEIAVSTFSEKIIHQYLNNNIAKEFGSLYSANGIIPIYEIMYQGKRRSLSIPRGSACLRCRY